MRVYLWTLFCAFGLHVCLYARNHVVLITVALSCVLNSGNLRSETSKTFGSEESFKVLCEFCKYFCWFCCCCLLFFKKYCCNLDSNDIECLDSFGKDGCFNIIAFSDPWTHNVCLLIYPSLILPMFCGFSVRGFYLLVKLTFILLFMPFLCTIFLPSFLGCSFCAEAQSFMLIFCPATLLGLLFLAVFPCGVFRVLYT